MVQMGPATVSVTLPIPLQDSYGAQPHKTLAGGAADFVPVAIGRDACGRTISFVGLFYRFSRGPIRAHQNIIDLFELIKCMAYFLLSRKGRRVTAKPQDIEAIEKEAEEP